MATIDDFGDVADPLGQPQLGGPQGWAAAVRDYIKDLPGLIAGKVSKAGDTMTGLLHVPSLQVNGNALLTAPVAGQFGLYNADGTALAPTFVGNPTDPGHAATRLYVDVKIQSGNAWHSGSQTQVNFGPPFSGPPYAIVVTPIAGQTVAIPTIRSASPSGFVFSVVNQSDNYIDIQVFWIAVGPV